MVRGFRRPDRPSCPPIPATTAGAGLPWRARARWPTTRLPRCALRAPTRFPSKGWHGAHSRRDRTATGNSGSSSSRAAIPKRRGCKTGHKARTDAQPASPRPMAKAIPREETCFMIHLTGVVLLTLRPIFRPGNPSMRSGSGAFHALAAARTPPSATSNDSARAGDTG